MTRAFADLRYGLRLLARDWRFTAVAVLTLALGIGANTAIFSILDAVLFRPLPGDTERVVVPVSVNLTRGIERGSVPYADYLDWRRESEAFEAVGLYRPNEVDLTGEGEPERIEIGAVSPEYFDVMHARPLLGRGFLPEEFVPGHEGAAVLEHGLWQRRFGSDRSVVGRVIHIGGTAATIVGVMPPGAVYPPEAKLWVPIRADPAHPNQQRRDNMTWRSVIRLREGVSIERGRAVVRAIAARVAAEHPESRKGWTTDLIPLRRFVVPDEVRLALLVLMGAVAFVLLIACVNVAGLLLARAPERGREMAIRLALGATKRLLVRQLLVESVLVAAIGGVLAIALAWSGVRALSAVLPAEFLPAGPLALDGRVLAVTGIVSLVTAVAFGLLPAFTASSVEPNSRLREGPRVGSGRRAGRLRSVLVAAELALALVLLVGAGLMVRSFSHVRAADTGVRVDGVIIANVNVPGSRYPEPAQVARFYDQLVDRVRSIPGVETAAAVSRLPAGGPGFGLGRVFLEAGRPEPPAGPDHPAFWHVVTPEYFATLGSPIVRGRGFTPRDDRSSAPVIVISETMARRMFPNEDPIGRRIRSWRDENLLRQIVGIARDVRRNGATDEYQPMVYVPHAQDSWRGMLLAVRTPGDAWAVVPALRRELAGMDPAIALANVSTLARHYEDSMLGARLQTSLLGTFSLLALLLSVVGVYGLMSHVVAQRSRELGLRAALGASPGDLARLVIGCGAVLTLAGLVAGLAGAVGLARVLARLLFEVKPTDARTYVWMSLVLVAAALVACWLPARRATRVEPAVVLRTE